MINQVEAILKALGGWGNITALEVCITCIRIEVRDDEATDEKSLHDTGTFGVAAVDKSIQVVMGPGTEAIVDAAEAPRRISSFGRP